MIRILLVLAGLVALSAAQLSVAPLLTCEDCKKFILRASPICLKCPCTYDPKGADCARCTVFMSQLPSICNKCICDTILPPVSVDDVCIKCNNSVLRERPSCATCPCRNQVTDDVCKKCYAVMDSNATECQRCPCINPPVSPDQCAKCTESAKARMPECLETCPCVSQPGSDACLKCAEAMGSLDCARCPCTSTSTCDGGPVCVENECLTCNKTLLTQNPECRKCPCRDRQIGDDICNRCYSQMDTLGDFCPKCPCINPRPCDDCLIRMREILPECLDCPCSPSSPAYNPDLCVKCTQVIEEDGLGDCNDCFCSADCGDCGTAVEEQVRQLLDQGVEALMCLDCPCTKDPGSEMCSECRKLMDPVADCYNCTCPGSL